MKLARLILIAALVCPVFAPVFAKEEYLPTPEEQKLIDEGQAQLKKSKDLKAPPRSLQERMQDQVGAAPASSKKIKEKAAK
jgi:hypothetical protein